MGKRLVEVMESKEYKVFEKELINLHGWSMARKLHKVVETEIMNAVDRVIERIRR